MTASGVDRGTQRTIYDRRRCEILSQHGIAVVELSYSDFAYGKRKRLSRGRADDMAVVGRALAKWLR